MLACGRVSAASLEQAKSDFITPAVSEGLLGIQQAAPRWSPVSMSINLSPDSYEIMDLPLSISLNGTKTSDGEFCFNGTAGSQYVNLSVSPDSSQDPGGNFSVFGNGVSLSVNASGGNYSVSGNVSQRSIWLQISSLPDGFSVWGQMGLNLSVSGSGTSLWMTGSADLNQFDESALAALGATLSAIKSLPPPK
jgi:hypothetical protein